MIDCTILILTYKGKHHLEHLLPTVKKVISNSPGFKINVRIVDNGQHQPTKDYAKSNFPEFEYIFSPVNDYLFSLNPFMKKMEGEFTLLLNDDIRLHPEIINTALPVLKKDNNLFGLGCNVRDWDDTYSASTPRELFYKRGWLYSRWNRKNKNDKIRYTLYPGGGASFIRTSMFNQLGGFDKLFRPAYCEDLDIGHRAWQQGWKTIYHPASILYHREGGTIKDQFKKNQLTQNIYKNQILWMVKNGSYPGFLASFLILLPYRLLFNWRVDKNSYIALWKSLPNIPLALLKRIKRKKPILNDKQIMKFLTQKYASHT